MWKRKYLPYLSKSITHTDIKGFMWFYLQPTLIGQRENCLFKVVKSRLQATHIYLTPFSSPLKKLS